MMKNWERYKRLKRCRKNFLARFHDLDQIEIMDKICRRYFWNGVIFQREDVVVVFGATYVRSFKKRVDDWIEYFVKIIRFNKKCRIHRDARWGRLHRPYKPAHLKTAKIPDRVFMEEYLLCAGFEVKDEVLQSLRSIYIIGPESPDY